VGLESGLGLRLGLELSASPLLLWLMRLEEGASSVGREMIIGFRDKR
jgi:hypothetical protein